MVPITPQLPRDYVLKLEHNSGSAPLLNIFGGKITTYRKLAEAAIGEISKFFPNLIRGLDSKLCAARRGFSGSGCG